jgi:hypothetical protein
LEGISKAELEAAHLIIKKIDRTKTFASAFPCVYTPLSCMLSAFKTYIAMESTLKDGVGSMEVYDGPKIYTHFPQENFEQFSF